MLWFTSDLHFGHTNILDYCKRPFRSLGHMEAELIKRWNARVKPEDTVYVVGDLALCPYKVFVPIAEQLRGKKVLVQGNHDHYSVAQYQRAGFQVFLELKFKLGGHTLRLSHYPYALPWYRRPFAYKSVLRFMERRPPRVAGETLVHGHVHMPYQQGPGTIHVGVDAWGYAPASENEVVALLSQMHPQKPRR